MKFKVTFICIICASFLQLNAQRVTYSTNYDDPGRLRNLNFYFSPLYGEVTTFERNDGKKIADNRAQMGWALGAKLETIPGVLDKRFGVVFRYRRAYNRDSTEPKQITATNLEIGGSFKLFEKVKEKSYRIRVSSTRTTETSLGGVTMTQLNRFFVRGGIFSSKSPVNVMSKDTDVRGSGFYGGIKFTRGVCYEADISGYGYRGKEFRSSLYADLMFAPKVVYSPYTSTKTSGPDWNPTTTTTTTDITQELKKINSIPKFGYRLGYLMEYNSGSGVGFNYVMEIGKKPPYHGYYFYIGGGISFNFQLAFNKQ